MRIEHRSVTIRELAEGYRDAGEDGVTGYDGALDIRPPYQREFIYSANQRGAVMDTVTRGFPLNVMYWAAREDGSYEVMDGQQRTVSICQYVNNDFSIELGGTAKMFHSLTSDERDQVLDYELMVYVCEGTESEKLDWFRTINIAGVQLTEQELRNAAYHGPWLADAKGWFSRNQCQASLISSDYVKVSPIRQELLERALEWVCLRDGFAEVEDCMTRHQHDPNATDLWTYFQSVISWVRSTFPETRREMKSVDWGALYHAHGSGFPDGAALEQRVGELMVDEDVTKKSGIYAYVLDGRERHLSIRAFTPNQKREAYERQGGECTNCHKHFEFDEMQGDHIVPWSNKGRTISENCQMLCRKCNNEKSDN